MKKTKTNCKRQLLEEIEKLPRIAPNRSLDYEEVIKIIERICVESC